MWRKTMTYLGLGPDEEYEDEYYEQPPEPSTPPRSAPPATARPAPPQQAAPMATPGPRIVPSPPGDDSDVRVVPAVRTLPPEGGGRGAGAGAGAGGVDEQFEPPGPTVRAIPTPARARPHVVSPGSFDDAMEIGNAFKQGQPVIMNLAGADRDLARRLIDFGSGVVFALDGSMERVAPQVYLITPTDVEVSDDDRRRLQERGLHR